MTADPLVDPDLAAATVARMQANTAPLFDGLAGHADRLRQGGGELTEAELGSLFASAHATAQRVGDRAYAADPLRGYRAYHLAYQAQMRYLTDDPHCRCHCSLCRAQFGE